MLKTQGQKLHIPQGARPGTYNKRIQLHKWARPRAMKSPGRRQQESARSTMPRAAYIGLLKAKGREHKRSARDTRPKAAENWSRP